MTGAKGSILRKFVDDKTRSSLESTLASIKRPVQQSAPRRWRESETTPDDELATLDEALFEIAHLIA